MITALKKKGTPWVIARTFAFLQSKALPCAYGIGSYSKSRTNGPTLIFLAPLAEVVLQPLGFTLFQ